MTPGTYKFPPHRRGDTFNGHMFEITQNDLPVDFTDAEIIIQFKSTAASKPVLQWLTSDGSITVSGAENNIINMAQKTGEQMQINRGVYKYDLQVMHANGITNTYVEGTIEIVNDISR